MASQLSSEHMAQLVPLLGSLARLMAASTSLNERSVHTLLLGADLDSNPAALDELRRWGRLLWAVQQQPTDEQRQATVEALLLRGLPEASILLAVATVVASKTGSAQSTPTPATPTTARLQASVSSLDFGILRPGQGATQELEVQGGPGHVIVESDQIQVTPTQFGAGSTRLRVELHPLTSGLLWTTLKLMTAGETREVPVMAQWQDGGPPGKIMMPPLQVPTPAPVAPPSADASTGVFDWAIFQPSDQRCMPIYFLVDVSASMVGAPIEAVICGLELFQNAVWCDPYAREIGSIGIITFGSTAEFITDSLVRIENVHQTSISRNEQIRIRIANEDRKLSMAAKARNGDITRLDLAFERLQESLDKDVRRSEKRGSDRLKGDFQPWVFVLTDGRPTDQNGILTEEWKVKRDQVLDRFKTKTTPKAIIAVGCGSNVDDTLLQSISTGTAFRMEGASANDFMAVFTYTSPPLEWE